MSKTIPAGSGTTVLFAIVDDEEFARLCVFSWRVKILRNGDVREVSRVIKGRHQSMHHDIIGKPPIGYVVDHINRNTLDNRRENLRFSTFVESSQNRRSYVGNIHKRSAIRFEVRFVLKTYEHAQEIANLVNRYRNDKQI